LRSVASKSHYHTPLHIKCYIRLKIDVRNKEMAIKGAILKKNVLHAIQVSTRRGELFLEYLGERVLIGGRTVTFFQGTIEI